jgi:hypothetical protein
MNETEIRWWKGNLHTHSLWSDGDQFPEMVAEWYKSHGYHFIAFTEHDCIQEGHREIDLDPAVADLESFPERAHLDYALADYRARFGTNWVLLNTSANDRDVVTLRELREYREMIEEDQRFLILQGEEITVQHPDGQHWANVFNLVEPIPAQRGDSTRAGMDAVFSSTEQQALATGHRIIVQLNHPNYMYNIQADKIAAIEKLKFMEIHTALNSTQCYGDAQHAGVERIWDEVLTMRLRRTHLGIVYGTATDDIHFFYPEVDRNHGGPGRAWIMVRSTALTPGDLLVAMEKGDFYASTGVTLKNISVERGCITLHIEAEPGVNYVTQFIGSQVGDDAEIGQIFAEVTGIKVSYNFTGRELYVRACVISSKAHPNPHVPGDREKAWLQPVLPAGIEANG